MSKVSDFDVCTSAPPDLLDAVVCLDELSKNVEGNLTQLQSDVETCRRLDCQTLTSEHSLVLTVTPHDCDSDLGRLFEDGQLICKDLTTVFADGSGERRGTHLGTFRWRSKAGVLVGRIQGMTNEGTHREPPWSACQVCDERGVMEGRLCGTVVRPAVPRLAGAQVVAAYRLRFDQSASGGEGATAGTVEGLIVRSCRETATAEA